MGKKKRTVKFVPCPLGRLEAKETVASRGALAKGDTDLHNKHVQTNQPLTEHGGGDQQPTTQSGPGCDTVILLRRGTPSKASQNSGSTNSQTLTLTPPLAPTPKKKVSMIPFTPVHTNSPQRNSPLWVVREPKCPHHTEPSPYDPTGQFKRLSLYNGQCQEPCYPGSDEGPSMCGPWAAGISQDDRPMRNHKDWGSRSLGEEMGYEEELGSESDLSDGDYRYYSGNPPSKGGKYPFRRKKRINVQPSVSWADDDYWATWDGWNVIIDWNDDGTSTSRRKGRNRHKKANRNKSQWADQDYQ